MYSVAAGYALARVVHRQVRKHHHARLQMIVLYAVFGQHLATFCYSRPVEVEAFDWSRGERYLRYRANGESAAWDLKRDEDSDFDDKWVQSEN